MQRLFENKGANTKDRAPMKQMIKRGLVYAIHAYIREISCQLSAVSHKPQAASLFWASTLVGHLLVSIDIDRSPIEALGDDGLFDACF
ncbi:hypothetical protein BCT04_11360 [Vibrio breoganii]|nr:hypothetical protein BCT04_11360 [Vibrio breoganii]